MAVLLAMCWRTIYSVGCVYVHYHWSVGYIRPFASCLYSSLITTSLPLFAICYKHCLMCALWRYRHFRVPHIDTLNHYTHTFVHILHILNTHSSQYHCLIWYSPFFYIWNTTTFFTKHNSTIGDFSRTIVAHFAYLSQKFVVAYFAALIAIIITIKMHFKFHMFANIIREWETKWLQQ